MTPKDIVTQTSDLHTLSRDIRRLKPRSLRRRNALAECTCYRYSGTTFSSQWPIAFSWTTTREHESQCPHSIYQAAVTDINIRFSLCSIALGRKVNVALAISRGFGSWTILPSLVSYRIVDSATPAFKLLANFHERIGTYPGPDAWTGPAQELFRLFQTRQASPHDRYGSKTLLHVSSYYKPSFDQRDVLVD